MFHYTITTDKSIEEAIHSLEEALKEHQFGIQWQMDIPSKLQAKGVEFNQPYRILEICNPHLAKQVLEKNELIGYFLPCKIVVYESKSGQTKIGLPKPSELIGLVNDAELKTAAEEVEQKLKLAVDKAVQPN